MGAITRESQGHPLSHLSGDGLSTSPAALWGHLRDAGLKGGGTRPPLHCTRPGKIRESSKRHSDFIHLADQDGPT